MSLVETVGFTDSFSFKYSTRPGTPAERRGLPEIDPAEAAERLGRLQALQRELTLMAHRDRVGSTTTVLVEGPSRHGGDQQCGRCPYNRVVNFAGPQPLPTGSLQQVEITAATPHSLLGQPASGASRLALPLV